MLSLLGIETATLAAGLRRRAIVWVALGTLALIAVVFILVAANAALSLAVGPIVAPLIIALVAAVIGLVVYLVAAMQSAAARKREEERRKAAETSALMSSAVLGALPILLKSPLLRQVGIPAVAAIASALLVRTLAPDDKEP